MKKICFINYDMSVRGGVEQVTASVASALTDFYEVHLISLCQEGELAYTLDPRVKYASLLEKECRLREMRKALSPLLKQYFVKNQIDIALIQGNYPGFLVCQMRGKTKTKLVFCDHGALMNQWDRKDIVFIRWMASLMCHKVVTLTEQSRSDYKKKFHLPDKKVKCIYNWMDVSEERSLHYDTTSKRMISAGRFGSEKGFDLLVKAFALVAARHDDWMLDIYGDGEMMPTVKDLVADLGLEKQVTLMGMRTDLAKRYREYAMYVLPSYREGMPLVLLEAKANRLPIVSFDIMTGPREIVRDGVDGILVPPYDLNIMAEAICSLIEDEERRLEMSKRSQDNLDTFSKTTIMKQWMDLIEDTCGK